MENWLNPNFWQIVNVLNRHWISSGTNGYEEPVTMHSSCRGARAAKKADADAHPSGFGKQLCFGVADRSALKGLGAECE